ncbi:MAG TPA: TrmH family RNA methyltransferase [Victivallales bacterium]|nr:TrmH family RNA methyltransferase [Victivallales bacterium]HPO89756.1 TrmH family RNA methyltransferase [Victivallales bacterium]HRR06086.1 TrmH family RNA methyltransferase [Victivallales bacterium]HRU01515.1 TrmH family RNA methyltransferase [Victivallales bacterium]
MFIHIVLDRLRSAYNTGNIFRIAEAAGNSEIICCGYTPFPPHPKLAKTAMGADKLVPFRHFKETKDAVIALKNEGVEQIFVVESLYESGKCPWRVNFPDNVAFIFGNEAFGVSHEIINICDGIITLPLFGKKTSINVANCAAVVIYSFLASKR